jgi:Zn finger protein HypA/HybF involved in hydrogenase expression
MKIQLVRSKDVDKGLLLDVYNLLIAHEGPLEFIKNINSINFEEDTLEWDLIFSEIDRLRKDNNYSKDDYIILLTSKPNSKNWFSSQDPKGDNSIFIHTGDWEYYILCETKYAVAFQIIENILQSLMADRMEELTPYFHDPPIGCINDMCSWKADVTFKLRTADICPDCHDRLKEQGVSNDLIIQSINIFERLRKSILFCHTLHVQNDYSKELPFPIATTKRKVGLTTDPLRKFLFLLDHFDSIIRTSVILFGRLLLRDKFDDMAKEQSLDKKPSLGHWVAALKSLSKKPHKEYPDDIPLSKEFYDRISAIVKKSEDEKIVNLRNEKRGHGYCNVSDRTYQNDFTNLSPSVEYIEQTLMPFLIRFKCLYIISLNRLSANDFEVRAKLLNGNHPQFSEDSIKFSPEQLDDIPSNNKVYAQYGNSSEWINLDPYLLYKNCPICHQHRVLITDGKQYLDPFKGHRVKL